MSLKLLSSGGGSVTIADPASTASNFTLNPPLNNGNLVSTGDTASVSQAMLASAVVPMGVGQTVTDVTASRATGTTYTNTTGRPILLTYGGNAAAAGNSYVYIQVNGTNMAVLGGASGAATNSLQISSVSLVVPAGATYAVQKTGTFTTQFWTETR